MGAIASQITSLTSVYSTVYSGADQRKYPSSVSLHGLCAWNSPVTGEFPAQRASNAEFFSIWWRHHEKLSHFPCTSLTAGKLPAVGVMQGTLSRASKKWYDNDYSDRKTVSFFVSGEFIIHPMFTGGCPGIWHRWVPHGYGESGHRTRGQHHHARPPRQRLRPSRVLATWPHGNQHPASTGSWAAGLQYGTPGVRVAGHYGLERYQPWPLRQSGTKRGKTNYRWSRRVIELFPLWLALCEGNPPVTGGFP